MDVSILIEVLPDNVKADIMNLEFGLLKGKSAVRVTLNRLLTEPEKAEMQKYKNILGINRVGHCENFPDKKMSIFVVTELEVI